jgi:hypothetical protein
VEAAALPRVDTTWLASRVTRHGAIVAGRAHAGVLEASQVYVKLPERVGPCVAMPIHPCAEGLVTTYERTADRCLLPNGCVAPRPCPLFVPACPAGYTLVSWKGGDEACNRYACDPTFATE